jgi:hypothetical protein
MTGHYDLWPVVIVPGFLKLQFKTFMIWESVGVPSRKRIVSGGVIYFL